MVVPHSGEVRGIKDPSKDPTGAAGDLNKDRRSNSSHLREGVLQIGTNRQGSSGEAPTGTNQDRSKTISQWVRTGFRAHHRGVTEMSRPGRFKVHQISIKDTMEKVQNQ